MNRTARRALADAVLAEVYAAVPAIACKGHCHHTCVTVAMSDRERERIRVEGGVDYPDTASMDDCLALTEDKRCGVYELRPLVCRVFGSAVGLRCPHGCRPDRVLDEVEKLELLIRAWEAGGDGGRRYAGVPSSRVREWFAANPAAAEALRRSDISGEIGDFLNGHRAGADTVLSRHAVVSSLFGAGGLS